MLRPLNQSQPASQMGQPDTQPQMNTQSQMGPGLHPYTPPQTSLASNLPQIKPTQDTTPAGWQKDHPWIAGALNAITSTVTQPNQALQSIGTGLGRAAETSLETGPLAGVNKALLPARKAVAGALGITSETQKAFETGATPTTSLEQGAGQALQAGANLATPIAMETGPLGLGLQGAALEAGQAMEQNKSASEVAMAGLGGGATGVALGKAGEIGGKVLKEGVVPVAKDALRQVFPILTNIPKGEMDWAIKNADKVLPKMQAVAQATEHGDVAASESALRKDLHDTAKSVYEAAKKSVGDKFEAGIQKITQKYPDAQGSLSAIRGTFNKIIQLERGRMETGFESVGRRGVKRTEQIVLPADEEGTKLVNEFMPVLQQHTDASVQGLRDLKSKIFDYMEGTDQGTKARRIFTQLWGEVDNELNRITNGEMKPLNEMYSKFKDTALELKPIWSDKVKEDTSRNFVASLENVSKGGSLDAMKAMEKEAGMPNAVTDELKATKIAKKFNWDKAPAGSRIRDQIVSALFGTAGGTIGQMVAGPFGAGIGASAGWALGLNATSPKFLSQFIFDEAKKQGIKVPGRAFLSKALENPALQEIILRALTQTGTDQQRVQ